MTHEITATIKRAMILPVNRRIVGEIYGDKGGRFDDGDIANTSPIVEELGDGLYKTKSGSIYKVELVDPPVSNFYRVVKGHDAYVEYATVVEADSPEQARMQAESWQFDGKWLATGDVSEFDASDVFEDRVEEIEASTLDEAEKKLAEELPERLELLVTVAARDTILAALRHWQEHITSIEPGVLEQEDHPLVMIATDSGRHPALTAADIDQLCEGINI